MRPGRAARAPPVLGNAPMGGGAIRCPGGGRGVGKTACRATRTATLVPEERGRQACAPLPGRGEGCASTGARASTHKHSFFFCDRLLNLRPCSHRPRPPLSLSPSQACAKRIEGKPDAHCTGQYFDMWACIDKCVSSKLFPLLK